MIGDRLDTAKHSNHHNKSNQIHRNHKHSIHKSFNSLRGHCRRRQSLPTRLLGASGSRPQELASNSALSAALAVRSLALRRHLCANLGFSKEGAWVIQAGACIPLARTTWAFMLWWIAQRCWACVQEPVKVTMMYLIRHRQRTSRPDAQRRDIPLRVPNGPGGPLLHPSLLNYAPGKEGLHEFVRTRPIAKYEKALKALACNP